MGGLAVARARPFTWVGAAAACYALCDWCRLTRPDVRGRVLRRVSSCAAVSDSSDRAVAVEDWGLPAMREQVGQNTTVTGRSRSARPVQLPAPSDHGRARTGRGTHGGDAPKTQVSAHRSPSIWPWRTLWSRSVLRAIHARWPGHIAQRCRRRSASGGRSPVHGLGTEPVSPRPHTTAGNSGTRL